jgi:hypothetical protein
MKATIVSTLPFALNEFKPGLIPAVYVIDAAGHKDFSITHIHDGYHNVLIPMSEEGAPPLRVTDTGEVIARSIIIDFIGACLGISYEPIQDKETGEVLENLALPGLFYVEGVQNKNSIKANHSDKLELAFQNTTYWFERLVMMADNDWQRTHQHKVITHLQRMACKFLNLTREWNFEVMSHLENLCWACKSAVHPDALICMNCKTVVKPDEYNAGLKERGLSHA